MPSDGSRTERDAEDWDPYGVDAWEALKARMPPKSPTEQAEFDAMMARALRPLAPGDPRRHHYIPQFFQKRFATEDEQLVVEQLDGSDVPRLTHIKHVAVVRDLYTTRDDKLGETVAVERLLAELDGVASQAVARLLAGLFFPPMEPDRSNLAMWFAMLAVRDPHTRRVMEALGSHGRKLDFSLASNPKVARARLREFLGRDPSADEVRELVEEARHVNDLGDPMPDHTHLVGAMLDVGLMAYPHFLHRRYLVVHFPKPGLVLSDRPVVLSQHARHRVPGMGVGLINADEVLIPLDRWTVVLLHRESDVPEAFGTAPNSMNLDEVNRAVIANAVGEIYYHPDDAGGIAQIPRPPVKRPLLQVEGCFAHEIETDGVNAPPRRARPNRYRRSKSRQQPRSASDEKP